MSEPLSKKIEEARKEVERIQAERDVIKKWTDEIHLPLHKLPPANQVSEVDQYNKFHYLSSQLAVAQQILSSLLLESLKESTDKLDSSVQTLTKSSDAQLKTTTKLASIANTQSDTTKRLESSSNRLVYLTAFLILLTTVTLTDTFTSYYASGGQLQFERSILAIILLAVLTLFGVYWGVSVIQQWQSAKKRKVSDES